MKRPVKEKDFRNPHTGTQAKLTLVNTLFSHKVSTRTTWHAPDYVTHTHTHTHIDYIIALRLFKSRSSRAEINSNHLVMIMKQKLRKNFRNHVVAVQRPLSPIEYLSTEDCGHRVFGAKTRKVLLSSAVVSH